MIKPKALPSREELLRHLRYDPETGFMWRLGTAGIRSRLNPVGCRTCRGHDGKPSSIKIVFAGIPYYAHRLIWRMMTGDDPGTMQIDHINRNPFDNRWGNLRLADSSLNARNKGSLGASSHKGVCFHARDKRWMATCWVNGKQKHLGYFKTEAEAAAVAAPYHIA